MTNGESLPNLKVKKSALVFAALAFTILVTISILSDFGVINMPALIPALMTLFIGLFVSMEVGILGVLAKIQKGRINIVNIIGGVFAVAAVLIGTIAVLNATGIFAINVGALASITAIVKGVVLLYVWIVIFT